MIDEQQIRNLLNTHKIRPSNPRVEIMKYMMIHRNHPTVDTIYSNLVGAMPSLSRTTVYNTLKLFVEKGITQLISIEENETRYDADVSLHAHFKCSNCGGIFDLPMASNIFPLPGMENFTVHEYHVYMKGICGVCREAVIVH